MKRILFLAFAILCATSAHGQAPAIQDYSLQGTGPNALVMIPCFSCRWKSFEPFMQRNLERYTMLAVTPLGFGGSAVPALPMDGPTTVWQDATIDAIIALIRQHDLKQITMIGHSLGGSFASRVAARVPDRVARLILLDVTAFSDRSGWFREDSSARLAQANNLVTAQRQALADPTAWQQFNAPPAEAEPRRRTLYHGWFMATPREVVLQYWRENSLFDLNPIVAGLTVPVIDLHVIAPGTTNADSAKTARLDAWRRNGRPKGLEVLYLVNSQHFIMEERPAVLDSVVATAVGAGRYCPAPADAGWQCGGR